MLVLLPVKRTFLSRGDQRKQIKFIRKIQPNVRFKTTFESLSDAIEVEYSRNERFTVEPDNIQRPHDSFTPRS